MSSDYPNLDVPIGSKAFALEAITSGNRGRVAYNGKIYMAKAKENITTYKEVVVVDESTPRGIVERRAST